MNIWNKNTAPEHQLEFSFMQDIYTQEAKPKCELKRIAEPKNDNDILFNLQAEYYEKGCDDAVFWKMWTVAEKVVGRLLKKKIKQSRHFYNEDEIEDKKGIAVEYVMRRFKYGTGYVVEYNWIVALENGVKHALEYQTKADQIVVFVPQEKITTKLVNILGDEVE